jgi:Mor family transcriptional regulator
LIHDTDDKKQRDHALFELDDLITQMMDEAEASHYLAGMNDVMQIFNITQKGVGDIDSRRNQGD